MFEKYNIQLNIIAFSVTYTQIKKISENKVYIEVGMYHIEIVLLYLQITYNAHIYLNVQIKQQFVLNFGTVNTRLFFKTMTELNKLAWKLSAYLLAK